MFRILHIINNQLLISMTAQKAKRKINKEEWELFINEHTVNMLSLKAICKKYSLVYGTLYYGLIRKGVTPNTTLTTAFDRRHFDVKDNFFSDIDTEEKAYILGFLIADGTIDNKKGRISLKLKESDKYILERIKGIIAPQYKLSKDTYNLKYLNGIDKNFVSYRLEIKSEQLVKDLMFLGVIPNKTGIETLPNVKKEMIPHIIRGIFDGDGSISRTQRKRKTLQYKVNMNICSTSKPFLEQIKDYIDGNIYLEKREGMDMYRLVFTNKESQFNFKQYIYKDATIYLDRKYQKMEEYVNTVEIPNDKGTP